MLRTLLNDLTAKIELQSESHLLIKDGRLTEELRTKWVNEELGIPENADKEDRKRQKEFTAKNVPSGMFISRSSLAEIRYALVEDRNLPIEQRESVRALAFYLPGSSIRGAFRSHLEKVLRSLDASVKVCDPLLDNLRGQPPGTHLSCSNALVTEGQPRRPSAYALSCPVCRLFGSAAQASRIWFSDATFSASTPVVVDNISVSRHTGSVLNPFKFLSLRDATAKFEVRIRNFELWHLGLLANLFSDAANSLIPLGSGKNKGNGVVKAATKELKIAYYGLEDPCADGAVRGIEQLGPDPGFYDFKECKVEYTLPGNGTGPGWRHEREIRDPGEFWGSVRKSFTRELWKKMEPLDALRKKVKPIVEQPAKGA